MFEDHVPNTDDIQIFRYLEHQRGTIGLLKIRINEGRNFKSGERGDSEMVRDVLPILACLKHRSTTTSLSVCLSI